MHSRCCRCQQRQRMSGADWRSETPGVFRDARVMHARAGERRRMRFRATRNGFRDRSKSADLQGVLCWCAQCVRQPAAPVHRVRSRARHLGSCRSIARARRRDVAPSGAARPGASARWRVPRRPSPVSTTRSSISRAPALGDRKPRPTCFAVGARRANRSASPHEADHVRTSVTSTASTGPSGASSRYCGYFSLSKASARSRSAPSSSTRARPRTRIHQSRLHCSA